MGMFQKATKSASTLSMALTGPPHAGKTYSSLAIATALAGDGGRIAVIDTERGSASKYADLFNFDVLELGVYDPRSYIEAIQAAEAEGYAVVVIDSLSHEWTGRGGALEMVNTARVRSRSGNSFAAWREVTPLHNALIEAIVGCRCHLIATMRSKVEYILQTNEHGRQEPVKVGMAPVQRGGIDYEFDVVGEMTIDHKMIVTKSRCVALDGAVIDRPGKQVADVLRAWLSDGATPPAGGTPSPLTPSGRTPIIPAETIGRIADLISQTEMTEYQVRSALARRGVTEISQLSPADAADIIRKLEERLGLFPSSAMETGPSHSAPTNGSPSSGDAPAGPAATPVPDASEPAMTAPTPETGEFTIADAARPERSGRA